MSKFSNDEAVNARPTETEARGAIDEWLETELGQVPPYRLSEDGEDSWSFSILPEDTTSYLHHDLTVEWYGTSWDADRLEPGN